MRKLLTLCSGFAACFFLLLSHPLRAQLYHFPQPGMQQAEVYHQDWTQNFQPVNYSFIYQNDTVVGAYTYSKFSFIPVGSSNPFYMYSDSGRVYHHGNYPSPSNPTGGTLMYDFSLTTGDTFHISSGSFVYQGDFVVDSVGTILLANGQTRKYMELVQGSLRLKWVDAIGDIEHGFFYLTDFEGGYEEFICHDDSSGHVYSAPSSSFNCSTTQPIPGNGPNTCGVFSYTTTITPTSCSSCTGSIQVSGLSGGTPGYTYQWSSGQFSPSISGCCSAAYTLTITDAQGTSCSQTYFVGTNLPVLTLTVGNGTCSGTDTICAVITGGVSPYSYSWSNGATTSCIVVSVPGVYQVMVYDAMGCLVMQQVTVNSPAPVSAATTLQQPSCSNCCDGTINVSPSGGTPPYLITHLNGSWPAQGNFCNGTYYYCVMDSLGCSYCDSVVLSFGTGMADIDAGNSLQVYPNPAGDRIRIRKNGNSVLPAAVYDYSGRLLQNLLLREEETQISVSDWPAGVYTLSAGSRKYKLVVLH